MPYNRDEFIALLSDYYEFCRRVFWDDDVAYPPPGGWPTITEESMANLNKNDVALDLIRHLPFTTYDTEDSRCIPHVMNCTYMVDYHHQEVQEEISKNKVRCHTDPAWPISSSCVTIGASEGLSGYYIIFDTDDGLIYWADPNGEHDEPMTYHNLQLEACFDREDPAEEWRFCGVNVYEPVQFFNLCKQRYRELRWIGTSPWTVERMTAKDDWDCADDDHLLLMKQMRSMGWPGDGEGRGWDRQGFEKLVSIDETLVEGSSEEVNGDQRMEEDSPGQAENGMRRLDIES